MRADSITRAFNRARDAAGIEDLHFHDLRHEATSRLFELGLKDMQVAKITGHRDWRSLERYTQLRPDGLADEIDAAKAGRTKRSTEKKVNLADVIDTAKADRYKGSTDNVIQFPRSKR